MTLDFPSRYESVQFPFGFFVLNYTSRILTAHDNRLGTKVDLQVVPISKDDLTTIRNITSEIETRGKLRHKNLLPWLHVFAYKDDNNPVPSLCFSFPMASLTLLDMLGYFPVCPWPLTHDKVAWIAYQLLSVLDYLHCCGQVLLHLPLRNIHLSLDGSYDLKLQDFGWKYPFQGEQLSVEDLHQCLRFSYKWNGFSILAPEVLAVLPSVNKSADLWNLGCVLAMLLTRASLSENYPRPILCCPGSESLEAVASLLGSPPVEFWGKLSKDKKVYFPIEYKSRKSVETILLPEVADIPAGPEHTNCSSRQATDLLERLLAYPDNRITTEDALKHPYLSSYYNENDMKTNKENSVSIPDLRRTLDELGGDDINVRLHRGLTLSELHNPLDVCSLQEMCVKTIEVSRDLDHIKNLTFPKSLIKRIVDRVEYFAKS